MYEIQLSQHIQEWLDVAKKLHGYWKSEECKSTMEQRLKNSKFAKIIATMSDEQIKVLSIALMFDKKVIEATNMFATALNKDVQVTALKTELTKRSIKKLT